MTAHADHHKERKIYHGNEHHKDIKNHNFYDRGHKHQFTKKKGKGNETSGIISVILLILANFSVILSLLLKLIQKFLKNNKSWYISLVKFNIRQKKIFKSFHYYLNPIAIFSALIHYYLSSCQPIMFPQYAFYLMLMLTVSGLIIKFYGKHFKFVKKVQMLHTHPFGISVFVLLLLLGHLFMD